MNISKNITIYKKNRCGTTTEEAYHEDDLDDGPDDTSDIAPNDGDDKVNDRPDEQDDT